IWRQSGDDSRSSRENEAGGVLAGEEEAESIVALAQRFPQARITLDPNGAWSLNEAIKIGKYLKGSLALIRQRCGFAITDEEQITEHFDFATLLTIAQ
ncbi:hypothetical protein ACUOFC_54535, partial [Escherichia sp. TWPC-MK]